jgi:hypothetical protein
LKDCFSPSALIPDLDRRHDATRGGLKQAHLARVLLSTRGDPDRDEELRFDHPVRRER